MAKGRIAFYISLSPSFDNGIENTTRPVVVERKNHLFYKKYYTIESLAIIYSFIGCYKAAKVDFQT